MTDYLKITPPIVGKETGLADAGTDNPEGILVNKRPVINTFTSIRFFMIWIIAIGHIILFYEVPQHHFVFQHFVNTNVAVYYFFMLSGFGLTYGSCRKNESIIRPTLRMSISNATKRLKKTYWLYCMTMIVELIRQSTIDFDHFFRHICELPLVLSLLQSLPGKSGIAYLLNAPCWFISVLFVLYIIWPLLEYVNDKYVMALAEKKMRIHSTIISVFIILFLGVSVLLKEVAANTWFDGLNYTSPVKQIFPFILGVLLSDFVCHTKFNISFKLATILEIICVIITCFWYFKWRPISSEVPYLVNELVYISIPMLLLYVFYFEKGYISKLLLKSMPIKLGQLSMYVFLLHWPVSGFIIYITNKYLPHSTGIYIASFIIVMVAIMSLSLLTSKLNKIVQKI